MKKKILCFSPKFAEKLVFDKESNDLVLIPHWIKSFWRDMIVRLIQKMQGNIFHSVSSNPLGDLKFQILEIWKLSAKRQSDKT